VKHLSTRNEIKCNFSCHINGRKNKTIYERTGASPPNYFLSYGDMRLYKFRLFIQMSPVSLFYPHGVLKKLFKSPQIFIISYIFVIFINNSNPGAVGGSVGNDPTHDSIRDYYGAPIRADSFWISLLAHLNLFGFMSSPASLRVLLCKPRPRIVSTHYSVVSVWKA